MGSEWINCELGDVIEFKRGYDLPKTTRLAGNIPVVSSSGESGLHNESKVTAPGVVTGRYGTIGEVFYLETDFWPLNTTLYVRDFKGNDPLFIYYFLKTISYSDYTDKAAVPGINRNHIHKAKVKIPKDKHYQKKLAEILRVLDNKITLNRQINKTLEQMAQALFKSWFVDFDPVVDNALDAGFFEQDLAFSDELLRRVELRKTARKSDDFKPSSKDIRQLFPDAFEEGSEPALGLGGWVPKGWQVGELGDVLLLRNERTKPSEETINLPYVPIECIGTKTPFLSEWKSGEEANSSLLLFKKGDILFGAMRPYFHKVCIAPFDGVTRSTVFTLIANDPCSLYFSFFMAYQESTVEYATLHSEGSTIPYAKWKSSLERKLITLPTIELQQLFHQQVESFIEVGDFNNEQSKNLEKLRDTLLPKLISGELSLDDIKIDIPEETLI
ncbi:restriction endonuclease subunit S [Providencia huaxiensis]|uniref:restriction endonuclease subunit S n=1 Tax=Providencia huaxiensis TaxID=2027290 RepID=UPI0032DA158A